MEVVLLSLFEVVVVVVVVVVLIAAAAAAAECGATRWDADANDATAVVMAGAGCADGADAASRERGDEQGGHGFRHSAEARKTTATGFARFTLSSCRGSLWSGCQGGVREHAGVGVTGSCG